MPKTLDPRYATDVQGGRITQQLTCETLVDLDQQLTIVPKLAESFERVSATGVRFVLRQGVRFHDGSALDAHTVKAAFEEIMAKETGSPYGFIRNRINRIEVESERELVFYSVEPQPGFLMDLFIPVFKHVTESEQLSCTGPYQIKQRNPLQLTLQRFEGYWQQPAKIAKIQFKIIRDDTTRYLKMRNQDLDLLINGLPVDKLKYFRREPLKQHFEVIKAGGLSYQYLGLNTQHEILRSTQVRQAIAYAIDIDEMIKYFKWDNATPADSLLTANNPYYTKPNQQYTYNPEEAARLLDAAGYRLKDEGRFVVEYKTTNNAEAVKMGRIIKGQLKRVGIEVVLRSFEWGTFFADVQSGNFEIYSLRWVGVTEPSFYFNLFHSSQIPPNGKNRVRFVHSELDQLLEQAQHELNPAKRKILIARVQQILAEELPYISLWHNDNIAILKRNLKGFWLHPTGGYHSLKDVYFSE